MLSGAAAGACATAVGAVCLWKLRIEPRSAVFALSGLGALAGAVVSVLRRFTATETALFLDARLGSAEAVTSALATGADGSEPARAVRERAEAVLRVAEPRRLRVPVLRPAQLALLPALALGVWFCRRPLPAIAAEGRHAPGTELVKRAEVPGLERIEALQSAASLSQADAERLQKLADEARRLRADLARGLEKREAQARIAALRDGIAAERQRFGDHGERPGLEAAIGALESERPTERAAKALGDGDIVAFDDEMQRLANRAETRSRDAARRALDEAARRAREKGAQKLAELLDRQRRSFAEREARMQALRELERALGDKLGDEAQKDRDELDRSGDPRAAQRLAEALADALNRLDETERRQLTDALKRRASALGEQAPLTPEQIEQLVRELASEEGRRALAERLRDLAREDNADSERERALGDAERGGAEAERGLGAAPVPVPGPQAPAPGTPKSLSGNGDPGPSRDDAAGKHDGETKPLPADELRARASGRWLPGAPLAARSLGRAPGRAGETANQVGSGNLGTRASDEVSAVERADIPQEYREQVGRYFEP